MNFLEDVNFALKDSVYFDLIIIPLGVPLDLLLL